MAVTQDSGHRGAQPNGLAHQPGDKRITDLAEELQLRDPAASNHEILADPHRTLAVNNLRFNRSNPIVVGVVVQAIPYLNWYKVLLGEGNSFIGCSMGSESSFLPLGVRSTSPIPPYSTVLVLLPQGLTRGIILCVLPEEITEGKICVPDWLQQGGGSGVKRETAHQQPIKNMYREGGVKDFSSHRPLDATALEWGKISETGIGIMIDSFQAYLRVNEACGLFLNYFDSYVRLAGLNLDIQTYARQIESREDEGELQYVEGNLIYPWEATGCYSSDTKFTQEFTANDVQYRLPRGKIDLAVDEEDLQPIQRGVEYGGYLGQGYQRFMSRGAKTSGKRLAKDQDPDYGLWQEHVALDGSYTMRSAKSVFIGKRILIPVPKRVRPREDQKIGDDARKDNYKFSSQFGGGDDHKVGDVKIEGEQQHLRRVAGVLDLLTYNYNWKSLHAFHYHKEDYKLHDESELSTFKRATDKLQFSELSSQEFMSYPTPKTLKIDHRYSDVEYFQRESFLAFHEDGSVALGCGYGSQIIMSGGQLRLEAPGDIMVLPGKRAVVMGWDVIVKAKNSVDVSASDNDVRIKAEKNMQLLAGNGGKGGVLIESKGNNLSHSYENKYGEDVVSGGILLLAKKAEVSVLAGDIYLRTGGDTLRNGDITIDASKGKRNLNYYAKNHNFFAGSALSIWHSPSGETSNMSHSHHFSQTNSKIDGQLTVARDIVAIDGNIVSGKDLIAKKDVIAITGKQIQNTGFTVTPHEGQLKIDPILSEVKAGSEEITTLGNTAFKIGLAGRWYAERKLGNEQLLQQIGFSFRDPPGSPDQYKTASFKLLESRWQQLSRLQLGSGGVAWTEKPVAYQGADTYPWPGKQKSVDEDCLLRYKSHTLFDDATAHSKDRAGPYEDPKLNDWAETKIDGNYKLILN